VSVLNEAGVFEEKRPFRDVKTYVVRASRMTSAQKRNYAELAPKWCVPYGESLIDYAALFGNDNPVTIEIGFGMGQATARIAEENPLTNYLGIEVHRPGIGRLLGEIKNRNLSNLFIVEYDAVEVFQYMIPDNSLAGIHVFFPDPWPKKRHHKRRLIKRPFLTSSTCSSESSTFTKSPIPNSSGWRKEKSSTATRSAISSKVKASSKLIPAEEVRVSWDM